jgi:hypothetical protein
MNFTILSYEFEDSHYFISPFTGNLMVSKSKIHKPNLNQQISNAIWLNDNPYNLTSLSSYSDIAISQTNMQKLMAYNKKLMWLGNKRFLISCIYSRLRIPIFENTVDAFDYISNINIHQENKGKICLQRSLLAAKTSKSFKKNGTLFIGAQFPTGIMHAWIIENGIQPDRQDREWIMYKPLLAITF